MYDHKHTWNHIGGAYQIGPKVPLPLRSILGAISHPLEAFWLQYPSIIAVLCNCIFDVSNAAF